MPPTDPFAGHRMDDDEVNELLTELGFGVLSMTDGETPYGVPLSFGFDGDDRLFFRFTAPSSEGRKLTFAERSARGSFLAYRVRGPDYWHSVLAEGPLDRITTDEWDAAREAMADNAWEPALFDGPRSDREREENPRVWALRIDRRGGRKVTPGQS
jgi:hypothetical protein